MDKQTFLVFLKELQPIDEESKIDKIFDRLLEVEKWDEIDFSVAKGELITLLEENMIKSYFFQKWDELDLDDIIKYQKEKRIRLERAIELSRKEKEKKAIRLKLFQQKHEEQKQKSEKVKKSKKRKKKKGSISKNPESKMKKLTASIKKSSNGKSSKSKNEKSKATKKKVSFKQPYAKIIYVPMGGKSR